MIKTETKTNQEVINWESFDVWMNNEIEESQQLNNSIKEVENEVN